MTYNDKYFIAKKIKFARRAANLTQEELAEKIGISAKQLSRIEQGNYSPSLPTFLNIISILKINISEFGVENIAEKNESLNNFIKLLCSLPPNELEFCYKNTITILENLKVL